MEIRDLETLGPLVASSLRSDATAQGPRVSKSRISMDSPYTQPKIIGLDSISTAVGYRIEDNEELESST